MTDDETAHVHIRVSKSVKSHWKTYLDESQLNTLSALIRVAVKDYINSSDGPNDKYTQLIELINEQNTIIKEQDNKNNRLIKINEQHKEINNKILKEILENKDE